MKTVKSYNYFDIVKSGEIISDLKKIIHVPTSFDGYSLIKNKDWRLKYFFLEDFHNEIDDVFKFFFKSFFGDEIYLIDLPFCNKNDQELEFYRVKNYQNFINLWNYYNLDNYNSGKYKKSDNQDFIIEQFFFGTDLAIFNKNLDWIFYSDVDTGFEALLYSTSLKVSIEDIFKDYKKSTTAEVIRKNVSNFATKNWF